MGMHKRILLPHCSLHLRCISILPDPCIVLSLSFDNRVGEHTKVNLCSNLAHGSIFVALTGEEIFGCIEYCFLYVAFQLLHQAECY